MFFPVLPIQLSGPQLGFRGILCGNTSSRGLHKSQYYEFLSDSPYAILVVDTYEKGPSKEAASSDEVVTVSGPRQVEGQERIVVEHEGDKSKTFTQMVALLPPGECRFAVAA